MADVDHLVFAKIAPNRTGGRRLRIRRPKQIADPRNCVLPLKRHRDHGCLLHEFDNAREKWQMRQVGVVLAEDGLVELHHLDGAQVKASGLKTGQDGPDQLLGNGVWFEQNE